jgi:L-methionine (R)-S-oxide reductase
MAESIPDLRRDPKDRAYAQLHAYILQVLAGIDDDVAGMATMSAFLHHALGFLWTGFYRVVSPSLLRVGPYQGSLGCLDITFGRGVCGTAAAERRTIVVPDVDRFPGHITCDSRSKSEIVVPVFNANGTLIAVLDIDSDRRAAFDDQDAEGLERIVRWFAGVGRS